jgi:hypothetical protein
MRTKQLGTHSPHQSTQRLPCATALAHAQWAAAWVLDCFRSSSAVDLRPDSHQLLLLCIPVFLWHCYCCGSTQQVRHLQLA